MNAYYIHNGNVVLPDRVIENSSVTIHDETIVGIDSEYPSGFEKIDAKGGYILPGFIDIHVHGGGGADFMDATVESFHQVACAHLDYGTTALCPTTMTCPDELLKIVIACYKEGEKPKQMAQKCSDYTWKVPFFLQQEKVHSPFWNNEYLPKKYWRIS